MSIADKLKHAVFEEDEKPKAQAPTPAVVSTNAPVAMAHSSFATTQIAPTTDSAASSFYDRLAKKTDFTITPVGTTIQEYLEPLASLNFDEQTKFKTAFLQAQKHSNITAQNVLDELANIDAILESEQSSFAISSKAYDNSIAADEHHAAELQQELQALAVQIAEAHSRSERAKAEFASAVQRRSSELQTQRAHYAALLKG